MSNATECDVCGYKMVEGDYGQANWICTNKDCLKSEPDWPFNEHFAEIQGEYEELSKQLKQLSSFIIDDEIYKIKLDEVRWIGEGSGTICNEEETFLFFIQNTIVHSTSDFLKVIQEHNIDKQLVELTYYHQSRLKLFSR